VPHDSQNEEFEPVRKTKIYEEVVEQIQRRILDGRFKPGDKLPPERDLADAFGVSRTSVRDAIRVLELIGQVEPRQGEGTVVRDVSLDSVATPFVSVLARNKTLLTELLDVRLILEPPLAARAAVHVSEEEIVHLRQILRRQEARVHQGELPIEEDADFHYTIAKAANNTIVLKVLDMLMDLLRESRERSLQVTGRLQKSLAGHRRILEAISRHDPAAAEAAMRQHIVEIQGILLKSPLREVYDGPAVRD
jgi:GntR family transcriptional repressor for pyruvate dehydrogenase complex